MGEMAPCLRSAFVVLHLGCANVSVNFLNIISTDFSALITTWAHSQITYSFPSIGSQLVESVTLIYGMCFCAIVITPTSHGVLCLLLLAKEIGYRWSMCQNLQTVQSVPETVKSVIWNIRCCDFFVWSHRLEVFATIIGSQMYASRHRVIDQHSNEKPFNLNQSADAMRSLCCCLYVLWQVKGHIMAVNRRSYIWVKLDHPWAYQCLYT